MDRICACGQQAVQERKSCETCLQKGRDRYRERVAISQSKGVCIGCSKNPVENGTMRCDRCAQMNRRRRTEKYLLRIATQICIDCKKKQSKDGYKRCDPCLEKTRHKNNASLRTLKDKVYSAYGGYICACCGETEKSFLSLDHKNNDGAEDRRSKPQGGTSFYRRIINNEFPDTLQVLCMNCQWGRARNNGICPHQAA